MTTRRLLHGLWLLVLTLALPAGLAATPKEEMAMSFTTFDVPFTNARDTNVTGLTPSDQPVGVYTDEAGGTHGFFCPRPDVCLPLLLMVPQDVTFEGLVTGFFTPPGPTALSWWYYDGTLRPFQVPRQGGPGTPPNPLTEAMVITPSGTIWGDYRSGVDGKFYIFRYDPEARTFLTIAHPEGALSATVVGLDAQEGVILRIVHLDGVRRHYAYNHTAGTFELLTIPGVPDAQLVGRTSTGLIAGNSGGAGFVWDGTTLQVVEAPGAVLTDINGIREDGTIYGRYLDTDENNHGFIATPPFGSARQARQQMAKLHAPFRQEHCCPGSKRAMCRGR